MTQFAAIRTTIALYTKTLVLTQKREIKNCFNHFPWRLEFHSLPEWKKIVLILTAHFMCVTIE